MSHIEANAALARALGITDLKRVVRIDLTLRTGEPPRITVIRNMLSDTAAPARVQQVVQQFELKLEQRGLIPKQG